MKLLNLIALTIFGLTACQYGNNTSNDAIKGDEGGDVIGNADPSGTVYGTISLDFPKTKPNMIAKIRLQGELQDAASDIVAEKKILISSDSTQFSITGPVTYELPLYVEVIIRDEDQEGGDVCYITTAAYPAATDTEYRDNVITVDRVSASCDDNQLSAPQEVVVDLVGKTFERRICDAPRHPEESCVEFIEFGADKVLILRGGNDIVDEGEISHRFENMIQINEINSSYFLPFIVTPNGDRLIRWDSGDVYHLKSK
ncbi:MAG: hypothetical protein AB7T49_10830 [Oligoflexales bacterium]